MAEDMLALILERAQNDGFERVSGVSLEIGKLSHVEADAMKFCFDAVVANTIAEGAKLDIIRTEGLGKCRHCHEVSPLEQLYDPCPLCGQFGLEVTQGDQVRIKSLAVV